MMNQLITSQQLMQFDISPNEAEELSIQLNYYLKKFSAIEAWQKISKEILRPHLPFALHLFIFEYLFPNWHDNPGSAPAWIPEKDFIQTTHIAQCMQELKIKNYDDFHTWSTTKYEEFWNYIIRKIQINFINPPDKICDLTQGVESPQWFPGAKLNITDSCFNAPPNKIAIVFQNENGFSHTLSYADLNRLSNRIANSLLQQGLLPGDAIAIDMPMTHLAVAIYLGIIKMGGIVVSIADSFSAEEIATRLRIAKAKAIFTQDFILRNTKKIPLHEKIVVADAPRAIVLPCDEIKVDCPLRNGDIDWNTFLISNDHFESYACNPMSYCNILFSSGTTSDPKAIPWNHTTPIKVASDAFFHQNIHSSDILAWPTNLGWMMGPWLIFAALMNQATIALYDGIPRERAFGQFIQDTGVTFLGVVPTLVASWRQSHCMEGLNWQSIKTLSSTGECSNPEDMLYLMSLVGYKPIIEYCGGTEIGGAYVTSTVIQNNYPSVCTTPTLGLNFTLLTHSDDTADVGEVALIPPSIGLSTELLNADHHAVYYSEMPKNNDGSILRRHGDQIRRLPTGYCILGRADDTMNLGGIKVSSAEIERVISGLDDIRETAAIAVTPKGHGPSQLVIYAATQKALDKDLIKQKMQTKINQHLNPLFKIHEVKFINELPKTASNKIMRRTLRKQCELSDP